MHEEENKIVRALEEVLAKHYGTLLDFSNTEAVVIKGKLEFTLDLIQHKNIGPKLNPFLKEVIEEACELYEVNTRLEA